MLNTIEEALAELKKNKMIIVVDDEDRENEGDFIMPAETITTEAVNFMATFGRGLICTPLSRDIAKKLDLKPMVEKSEDSHETAFTVSIDADRKHGTSTGISARDRAITLKLLTEKNTESSDFVRPGHIFPLIAKEGGVLERPGHTEAAVDLATLCDMSPVGVICEILNPDGSCARLPELLKFAKEHDMKVISIEDLIDYKKKNKFYSKEGSKS